MEILSQKEYEIFLNKYFNKEEAMSFAQMYCKTYGKAVNTGLIRNYKGGWGKFLRTEFKEEFEKAYIHFIKTDFYKTFKGYFYKLDGKYYNVE